MAAMACSIMQPQRCRYFVSGIVSSSGSQLCLRLSYVKTVVAQWHQVRCLHIMKFLESPFQIRFSLFLKISAGM